MKMLGLKMLSLFFLMVGGIAVMGQDRQNVPGDDFSLEGALELFKKSESPEEFERLLNSSNSKVNNLDLNGDGEIDYIRVIDRNEGNVHAFILQAVISDTESQDVAVIELEKLANGKAVLQITGDEDVYGIETIIEPTQDVRVNAGTTTQRTVVNVWAWPSVQYVYSPYYAVWVSPWHWHMRPIWWHSWGPIAYYEYYSYWQPYRPYYAYCHSHRVYAQHIYRPYRTCSPVYYNRHRTQIVHYRSTHRDDRSRQSYRDDRNRTNYTVDRTNRSRDEGNKSRDYNTEKRTSTIKQRTSWNEQGKEKSTGYTRDQQERKTSVEKKPDVKERTSWNEQGKEKSTGYTRDQQERKISVERKADVKRDVYTRSSNAGNKPTVSERSSQPRNERSTTVNTNRSSQPRESRSVERSDRGKSSSGGSEKRSSGRGGKSK